MKPKNAAHRRRLSGAERLAIAVEIAEANLESRSTADWLKLSDQAHRMCGHTGGELALARLADAGPSPSRITEIRSEILSVSRAARSMLHAVVDTKTRKRKALAQMSAQEARARFDNEGSLSVPVAVNLTIGVWGTELEGSLPNMFLLELYALLHEPAARQLARCPECGLLFVRVRRQRFCSTPCGGRARWRAYKESGRADEAPSRRRLYDANGWTQSSRRGRK
jgi:hypothetical protein